MMVTQITDDQQQLRSRYPGSIPFTRDDEWVFFGRDTDIEKLKTTINVEKTIVLYSKSGLGKTSLLNAGVLPKLEKQYTIIPLRFGTHNVGDLKHPLDILDNQLSKCCSKDSFLNEIEPEDISLWQHLKNLQFAKPDRSILLVFDQFEELFTYSQGVDRFVEALAEVLYNRIPRNFQRALHLAESTQVTRLANSDLEFLKRSIDANVLIAIRSDRMGLLDRLSLHIPNILKTCYELKHLTHEQAHAAIVSPAQKEGTFQSEPFNYQPEALEKMLNYLTQSDEKPIETFQLQILCQYVENNIVGKNKNQIVKPGDLGNLSSIYHDYYDRAIKSIGTDQEQYKSRLLIEDGLIFEEEERRISLFQGQIESKYDVGPELLRKIVDTHIIRRELHGDGYMYELSHDSLVTPILRAKDQRQRDEEKHREEEIRRMEEEQRRQEEEKKRKADQDAFNLEMANQKAAYQARSAKRNRKFAIAVVILALIITGALIKIYLLQQELADKLIVSDAKARIRIANEQTKQSWPQLSLLLARQAFLINAEAQGSISSQVHESLVRLLDPSFFTQNLAHKGIVGPVAFSPNGKTLATGSSDKVDKLIYLWNLDNLDAEPVLLEGHTGEIYALVFSRTGKFLASAGEDQTVRLWEEDLRASEAPYKSLKTWPDNKGKIWSVAFSPDENTLAAAGEDKIIRLWDLQKPTEDPTLLKGHKDSVGSVAFSPDGEKLASGSKDHTIRLWDFKNPANEPVILTGHEDSILSVAFDPDGKRLASGSYDTSVRLWDLDNPGIASTVLEGHQRAVRSVAFSPDRKNLASASFDTTVRLWDLTDLAADPKVFTGHKKHVFSVAFSPDGVILASGSEDKTARLWYLKQESSYTVLRGHRNWISALAISPKGETLASGSHDQTIRLWNLKDPTADPEVLQGFQSDIWSVAFSPDGRWLAAGCKDKSVLLWNRSDLSADPKVLKGHHRATVWSVAFSSDNNWLASGSSDRTVCLWSLKNLGAEPQVLSAKWGKVYAVAFSPNDRWLAAGSDDMVVRLWNREKLEDDPIELRGHEGSVLAVTFSPDSETLASAGADKTVRLWNVKKPIEYSVVLRGHKRWIRSLVFGPDGNTLISGSGDKTVRYWNLKNPSENPIELIGHRHEVHGVTVSPGGEKIYSGGEDDTIIQWIASPSILADNICKVVTRNLSVSEWKQFVGLEKDYDRTCSKLPIHESLKDYIVDLARSGDRAGASNHLKKTRQLDPDFKIDIDKEVVEASQKQIKLRAKLGDVDGAMMSLVKTKELDPDLDLPPKEEIEKIAARGLIRKAERSIREEDMESAVVLYEQAKALDSKLNFDPEQKAKALFAEDLVRKAKSLARNGKLDQATERFKRANELDPSLKLDPVQEAKMLYAKTQVRNAENLAADGKLDQAIEILKKANELDSSLQLDPVQEAKMLYAKDLVRKAENLARDGKIYEASENFKKANELNSSLQLDPVQEANKHFAKTHIRKGRNFAKDGKLGEATASFQKAMEIDPQLELNPTKEAHYWAARGIIETGIDFARRGKVEKAIAKYSETLERHPNYEISASDWNSICWSGCTWGYHTEVMVKRACNKAAEMEPENGSYIDSRGLYRALTGDYEGAIEDFEYYVSWASEKRKENLIRQRKKWISELRAHKNPFDRSTLQEIKDQ